MGLWGVILDPLNIYTFTLLHNDAEPSSRSKRLSFLKVKMRNSIFTPRDVVLSATTTSPTDYITVYHNIKKRTNILEMINSFILNLLSDFFVLSLFYPYSIEKRFS